MTLISPLMSNDQTRRETCDVHGEFSSRHMFKAIWSKCPACASDRAAKEDAAREIAERQATAERWQKRLGRSGIPDRFQDRSLESFVACTDGQRHALTIATQYAHDTIDNIRTGRSLVMIGRPGTGKTHLAVGIGLKAMTKGYSVLFIAVSRAIRRIKSTWDRGSTETESQVIDAMIEVDILILDEIGVQFGSDTEKNLLFDILNGRYEARRPTVLLSNLDRAGVTAYLGERVMDRLREDGGQMVTFAWNSYRAQVCAANLAEQAA